MRRFLPFVLLFCSFFTAKGYYNTIPVVYLNFNGAVVAGTPWNSSGPIEATAYQIPEATKNEIVNRVKEDFSIFEILITTDSVLFKAAPLNRRIEVIITPTAWNSKGGGTAYVGSFNWFDYTPVWVFPSRLLNNIRYISEAVSHEVGHSLGLLHQSFYDTNCEKKAEYYEGRGGGIATSWAPIMGVSYYSQLSTWFIGTSADGCEFIQDDIAQMIQESALTLLPDEYGNNFQSSYPITATTGEFGLKGIINNANDEDVFQINLNKITRLKLDALPFYVGNNFNGANVHLEMILSDETYNEIGRYKSLSSISANIDTTLRAGSYYITVRGTDNNHIQKDFSIGTYSLAGILAHALPVTRLELSGQASGMRHFLQWKFEADEEIESISIQYSADGSSFKELVQLPPSERSYSWIPDSLPAVYYRVKVNTVNNTNSAYSKIILIQSQFNNSINIVQNTQNKQVRISLKNNAHYQLYNTSGSLLKNGKLTKGDHYFNFSSGGSGMLILKVFNNSELKVQKLMP